MKQASPALDRASQLACAVAACAAIAPLALVMPAWLNLSLLGLVGGALLSIAWRRPLPRLVRLPLTLGAAALVMVQYGVGFGGGFGRDTAAALLALMLVLKLLELHSVRDGRAILSFSLFAVFAAFLQDRGPLVLSLALASTLLVLAGLALLAEVESPERQASETDPPPRVEVRPRLRQIGTLAAASLPLAIVGFFLFPRLANPLWALPGNSNEARTGLSEEMAPGDISSLFLDDTPIMRVRFDGPAPSNAQLYWRGPVLSGFDGRRWTRQPFFSNLDPPRFEPEGAALSYEVEQEATDRRYVFALDMPDGEGPNYRNTFERTLVARQPLIAVSKWNLRSYPSYALDRTMVGTLQGWYRSLPEGFNPRTHALMQSWRSEGNDDVAIIQRALALFNAEFSYTLNPVLLGRNSVDDFLFNTKAGYCEHFASTFAVMMRAAGIPARVVTGYQGGNQNTLGDYLVVRQSDAHAWTEVWVADQGWVRIDPTSAVAPDRIDRGLDALGADSRMGRGWGRPLFEAADWLRRGWNNVVLGFDAEQQSRLLQPLGVERADWQQLAFALMAAAGLALAVTLGWLLRPRRDERDALARAYAVFLARLAKLGVSKHPSEPPLAFAERAAQALPGNAERIIALSQRYIRCRYAPPDAAQLEKDVCADLRRFRLLPESRP